MIFLPECGLSPSCLDMHVRFSEEEGFAPKATKNGAVQFDSPHGAGRGCWDFF